MPLEGQVVDGILPTPLQDLVIAGQDTHVETFLTGGGSGRPGLEFSSSPHDGCKNSVSAHTLYCDTVMRGHRGTEKLHSFKDHTTCKGKAIDMSSGAIFSPSHMLSAEELPSPCSVARNICALNI